MIAPAIRQRLPKLAAEVIAAALLFLVLWGAGTLMGLWPWWPWPCGETASLFIASPKHEHVQIYDEAGRTNSLMYGPMIFSHVATLPSGEHIFYLNRRHTKQQHALWVKRDDVEVCQDMSDADWLRLKHSIATTALKNITYTQEFIFFEHTVIMLHDEPVELGLFKDPTPEISRYQCKDNIPYSVE